MDAESAFLNRKIISEVYVNQPEVHTDGTNRVLRLRKALYGLSESPRDWYECFDKYIMSLEFEKNNVELFLYVKGKGEGAIYILLYVDDLLICSKNREKILKIKKWLSIRFNIKDLGVIKDYLEITVEYDYKNGEVILGQSEYIESLAIKYTVETDKLFNTPIETKLQIKKAEEC